MKCLAVYLKSHGGLDPKNGTVIYFKDQQIPVWDLLGPLLDHELLKGVPKVVIFEACRFVLSIGWFKTYKEGRTQSIVELVICLAKTNRRRKSVSNYTDEWIRYSSQRRRRVNIPIRVTILRKRRLLQKRSVKSWTRILGELISIIMFLNFYKHWRLRPQS